MSIIDKEGNETYVGAVIAKTRRDVSDNTTLFALVWDDETGNFKSIQYAGYYCTDFHGGNAHIDITRETWERAKPRARRNRALELTREVRREAARVDVRKTVRAAKGFTSKGIKVPAGAVGVVFWYGTDKFSKHGMRAGVDFDGIGRVFINADNVKVANWKSYRKYTVKEIREYATGYAEYPPINRMYLTQIGW
jgi:hypothetical protein